MNSNFNQNLNNQTNGDGYRWLTMSEASRLTPYSAEYLSLLARKKKLLSKKIGKTWYTTKPALDDYMHRQMIRANIQNGGMLNSLQNLENLGNNGNGDNFNSSHLNNGLDFNYPNSANGSLNNSKANGQDDNGLNNFEKNPVHSNQSAEYEKKLLDQKCSFEEQKSDSASLLAQEIRKLSELFGGFSNKIEAALSTNAESSAKKGEISASKTEEQVNDFYRSDYERRFSGKFDKFLDSFIEDHFGLISRGWKIAKKSFKTVFPKPKPEPQPEIQPEPSVPAAERSAPTTH